MVVVYYPRVCCSSITHVPWETKLSLLPCISVAYDPRLQELDLLLHLENINIALQINDKEYSVLANA